MFHTYLFFETILFHTSHACRLSTATDEQQVQSFFSRTATSSVVLAGTDPACACINSMRERELLTVIAMAPVGSSSLRSISSSPVFLQQHIWIIRRRRRRRRGSSAHGTAVGTHYTSRFNSIWHATGDPGHDSRMAADRSNKSTRFYMHAACRRPAFGVHCIPPALQDKIGNAFTLHGNQI